MRHDRQLEEPPEHPDDCICLDCVTELELASHPTDCNCAACSCRRSEAMQAAQDSKVWDDDKPLPLGPTEEEINEWWGPDSMGDWHGRNE